MEDTIFKISNKEGMSMKELIDAINNGNDAIITAFKAMLQNQTEIILKKMDTDLGEIKGDIKEILKRLEDKK